jgi:hypothetical protein
LREGLLERNRLHDVAFWFGGDEKERDPPSAVGGLMGFLVEGDVKKINSVLKSPWTAFHGSVVFE